MWTYFLIAMIASFFVSVSCSKGPSAKKINEKKTKPAAKPFAREKPDVALKKKKGAGKSNKNTKKASVTPSPNPMITPPRVTRVYRGTKSEYPSHLSTVSTMPLQETQVPARDTKSTPNATDKGRATPESAGETPETPKTPAEMRRFVELRTKFNSATITPVEPTQVSAEDPQSVKLALACSRPPNRPGLIQPQPNDLIIQVPNEEQKTQTTNDIDELAKKMDTLQEHDPELLQDHAREAARIAKVALEIAGEAALRAANMNSHTTSSENIEDGNA